MLPRSSTARQRVGAQSPSSPASVHPEMDSAEPSSHQQPQAGQATLGGAGSTKKSRGQHLWGKTRGTIALGGVDASRNPDGNTFRPNGVETEDDAREANIRKRDPLRGKKAKLAAYCVLLCVFLATSLGARPTLDIYSQNSFLENLMMLRVDEESGMKQQQLGIAWSFITTEEDFWLYMTQGIPGGLHSYDLSPGRELAALELLTGYRLKQVRVAKVPCEDAHPFRHTRALSCTPSWEDGEEETAAYGPSGIWTRSAESEVLGSDTTMRGFLGLYPLGGYIVQNVSGTEAEFIGLMEWLRKNRWVDTQTRAVQIDINVWNPTLRLISAIKLQAEFSVVGKVRTMYSIRTFEYKELVDTSRPYWWWEMLYAIMILTYALDEAYDMLKLHRELRKTKSTLVARLSDTDRERRRETQTDTHLQSAESAEGKARRSSQLPRVVEASLQAKREFGAVRKAIDDYLSDPWNYIDMTNYTIAVIVIVMELWSRLLVQQSKIDLNAAYPGNRTVGPNGDPSEGEFDSEGFFSHFVCFYAAAYLSAYAYTLMGLNAVVTWLKILKYLNLFPHLSMLSVTLRNAAYPVMNFSIMFLIVFLSCGQAFLLAFGPSLRDFSTFGEAMISLFRALLGDFDYPSLAQADPVVGPVLFTVYIFLVLFVLLNMFIAILTEAYDKAKVEVFGDAVHEREECWEGAISFLQYAYRAVTYTVRWSIPCLGNAYEFQGESLRSDGEDTSAKHNAAKKANEKADSFEEWMEARYRAQKLLEHEEGRAEVEEIAELVKAAASPVYHDAYAIDEPDGARRPVKLMVGSYGLIQLDEDEYTTYVYQILKQWDFGPKKGKAGLREGELRLTIQPDAPGHKPTVKVFQLKQSDGMTVRQKCDFISRAMMACAMAERADTFSTTLALKVLRLQVEQTEAQLQSKVNTIRDQVGSIAQHLERLYPLSPTPDTGVALELPPVDTLVRTPTRLPPLQNRPEAAALGESALVPHTEPSKESEGSEGPGSGRKRRQP